jgi:hypothetical protein
MEEVTRIALKVKRILLTERGMPVLMNGTLLKEAVGCRGRSGGQNGGELRGDRPPSFNSTLHCAISPLGCPKMQVSEITRDIFFKVL